MVVYHHGISPNNITYHIKGLQNTPVTYFRCDAAAVSVQKKLSKIDTGLPRHAAYNIIGYWRSFGKSYLLWKYSNFRPKQPVFLWIIFCELGAKRCDRATYKQRPVFWLIFSTLPNGYRYIFCSSRRTSASSRSRGIIFTFYESPNLNKYILQRLGTGYY